MACEGPGEPITEHGITINGAKFRRENSRSLDEISARVHMYWERGITGFDTG